MNVRLVKEKAARLVASGQYERAEILLRQALTQSPSDVQTWLKHAEVLKRLSRNADAVSSYRIAARLLDDTGHHHRAVAALKLGLALSHDDIDLITDIIRLEMRARRSNDGVRSLFPVSSPSQLLGAGGASSDSSLYSASSTSMLAEDAQPQLALPMTTSVSPVPRRLDTWVPEPTPPRPAAPSLRPESADDASTDGALFALITPAPQAEESAPSAPEALSNDAAVATEPPATDDAGPDASAAPAMPLELEVEDGSKWPQVRRLSETQIAVQAAEGARWVVLESTAAVSVRFEDALEIPDDAEWLE